MQSTKINRTVVRNAAYKSGEFSIRERHNERKNESYLNGDIDKSRVDMNVYYRQNFAPDGTVESYQQTFNRLLEEGKIVKRGLKDDAKIFDELIFDVNTEYFERMGEEMGVGGYEYAKSFFAEAYKLAVKEVGRGLGDSLIEKFGEDYAEQLILSAVLHADEKNKALSEDLGRDVYHYHLHVVYIPVVEKEIKWSKRTKDKSLIGKVKEVIPQISHSKKWPMRVVVEQGNDGRVMSEGTRSGKTAIVNSYSLLQDRFFEHMKSAGLVGFERGERGSTTEHLSDLEYKTMKESERLTAKQELSSSLDRDNARKKNTSTKLTATIQEQQITHEENKKLLTSQANQLASQAKKVEAMKGKVLTKKQIEGISVKISRPIMGGADKNTATMLESEWEDIKKTALTIARGDEQFHALHSENTALKEDKTRLHKEKQALASRLDKLQGEHNELQKEHSQLKNNQNKDFLERGKRDAELHNLKNAVARIPKDVWDMYAKPTSRQKNNQQEVR